MVPAPNTVARRGREGGSVEFEAESVTAER
jgi:hypothetical protein